MDRERMHAVRLPAAWLVCFFTLIIAGCGRSPSRPEHVSFDDIIICADNSLRTLAGFAPGQDPSKVGRYFPKSASAETLRKPVTIAGRAGEITLFIEGKTVSQVTVSFTAPVSDTRFEPFVKRLLEAVAKKKPTYNARDTQEDDAGKVVVTTLTYSDTGGVLTVTHGIANESEQFITLSLGAQNQSPVK
ncbi:MAG: hypothetical protein HZC28_10610 [Spirochaetes bacterium]|nr:hypothetical protein [Spirochaetota bacterium]